MLWPPAVDFTAFFLMLIGFPTLSSQFLSAYLSLVQFGAGEIKELRV
jgi:hypothetical protein